MKITLAGSPGSGKSTLRKMLADHYGLSTKCTGDFMRKLSREHGFNDITKFLVDYVSNHPEVDNRIDEEQRKFGEKNDNFILDAHLGFYFVPDSIRICLICELEEASERILKDDHRYNESASNIKDSIVSSRKRMDTMTKNFLKLYKVNIKDPSNFDLLIDTTKLSPFEVFKKISSFIDKKVIV
tara:strand:+ start:607 stop:1158 length:552 start_codon:yes stop_codon:yes gene_type:complete